MRRCCLHGQSAEKKNKSSKMAYLGYEVVFSVGLITSKIYQWVFLSVVVDLAIAIFHFVAYVWELLHTVEASWMEHCGALHLFLGVIRCHLSLDVTDHGHGVSRQQLLVHFLPDGELHISAAVVELFERISCMSYLEWCCGNAKNTLI